MTGRDRMVIVAVATALILVMGWFLFVSPERQRAASLNTQVGAANAALATAKSQVQSARAAQAQYQAAYADVVRLGKAVPPSEEVSSLVYQIAQASHQKNVDFASVVSGAAGTGSAGAGGTAATALSGFTPMPFTFIFTGTFSGLHSLLQQLDRSTVVSASGRVVVSGRLLTVQSVKLAPGGASGSTSTTGKGKPEVLTGTITATAYVLPAAQGLTPGATPSAPTGAGQPSLASSSSPAASAPTAPATARVTP